MAAGSSFGVGSGSTGRSGSQQKGQGAPDSGGVRGLFLDRAPPVGAPAPAKGRGEELVAGYFLLSFGKEARGARRKK